VGAISESPYARIATHLMLGKLARMTEAEAGKKSETIYH